MTSKERVQAVYFAAWCAYFPYDDQWHVVGRYGDHRGKVLGSGRTEQAAWDDAAKQCP